MWGISPVDLVHTGSVDAGVAKALVDLREAGGIVEAIRTQAREAIDFVHTGAAVVAGVNGALVNVDVTHGACTQPSQHHKQYCQQGILAAFRAKKRQISRDNCAGGGMLECICEYDTCNDLANYFRRHYFKKVATHLCDKRSFNMVTQ